ncbi:ABC transporter permease [Paenibacillus pasadenensis]|uniref:Xylose ABC transporter, permease component n=1 Tax=Paenibacillus pasadenensis TaxID=217090 RepID=A0A2N5N1N0_9BACL|nr:MULTISPECIES: ABC transporter permease subunit [Paenibacillus]PLT44225.1 Xylose ABC transporter, permease component [Paenibacillus pasadenensis]QGG54751.1 ABC transporter permease subunit [Paenibacillus sp. B01]
MFSAKARRQLPLHLMVLPSLVLVLIFSYGPIGGLVIAFQKFSIIKGILDSPFNGLDNFRYMLQLPEIGTVVRNTLVIACMKIVAGLAVPIVVSLLLNELRLQLFKRWIQTMIYLPHFLSWIILGGILIDILSPSQGIINQLLGAFGIEPVFFLGDARWFPAVVVVSDVWKEFGFSTIVYLAALAGINPALYEAAVIDGANRWKQTLHITLPGMIPVIVLLATLSLGNVLNAGFDQIFNLYSPVVYETGDIIDTLVYRIGLEQAQYSLATAVGLMKSIVSVILISVSYYLAYRLANYRIF